MTRVIRHTGRAAACSLAGITVLIFAGCGNQMFREPSFTPLDSPRAAPPATAVPAASDLTPPDGRPVNSSAYGDLALSEAAPGLDGYAEPALPPPNLSDNARNEAAPASVDRLISPLPVDPRIVRAGGTLFLNRCVQCHDPGGNGYGPVGGYLVPHPPDLAGRLVQKNSNGALYWHITKGQGKMPGFERWTTPLERWALVAYVRSLKDSRSTSDWASVTAGAPYPVYGEPGFTAGAERYPYKALGKPQQAGPSAEPAGLYAPQPLRD